MIKKNILGKCGVEVSELCFGALPFGPLQKNMPIERTSAILKYALEGGVTFVDTAQMYGTYEPIRRAMKESGLRPVIASKSTAADYAGMKQAVEEALSNLDVDYVDIFHVHAARSGDEVFADRSGAFEALVDCRREGKIRAVGISCHSVTAVREAARHDEIDVVFPIINIEGMGILHGSRDEMIDAIARCSEAGKGIYLMKVLAGGYLAPRFDEALSFARSVKGSSSIAMGIVSEAEVDVNIRYFDAEYKAGSTIEPVPAAEKRFIIVQMICKKCGFCTTVCPNGAISETDSVYSIDDKKCIRCGYCVGSCPAFAIRSV